jgi:uncharacterized membrane protein
MLKLKDKMNGENNWYLTQNNKWQMKKILLGIEMLEMLNLKTRETGAKSGKLKVKCNPIMMLCDNRIKFEEIRTATHTYANGRNSKNFKMFNGWKKCLKIGSKNNRSKLQRIRWEMESWNTNKSGDDPIWI